MERSEIKAIVENILLAADEPVTSERLAATVINEMPSSEFESILEELKGDYSDRNLQIIEVAEGFLLATRGEFSEWIKKFYRADKTSKLSQPALDTLSIIAYKQPITRTELEEIRGVDSAGVVRTLLDKKIVAPAGRKQVLGRPMMYKTTLKFLEYFGLKDLGDLPTLDDLKEAELTGNLGEGSEKQTRLIFEDPIMDSSPEFENEDSEKLADSGTLEEKSASEIGSDLHEEIREDRSSEALPIDEISGDIESEKGSLEEEGLNENSKAELETK